MKIPVKNSDEPSEMIWAIREDDPKLALAEMIMEIHNEY